MRLGYTTVQRLHHRQTRSHGTEGWKDASENNKWMIVQCATFSKSLNPQNIIKNVSDIRIRIPFPFESSFWISVYGCKLTILPDIQLANRILIIFDVLHASQSMVMWVTSSLIFFGQVEVVSCSYIASMLLCLFCWMTYVCAVLSSESISWVANLSSTGTNKKIFW